jgi:kynurenine 3-monooxygenase
MKPHIVIAGAGLAGSLMAVYLAKKGWKVDIYENRKDMRKITMSAGRSINLALSHRGLMALREVGLDTEIMKESVKMPGRMIHDNSGNQFYAPYGRNETEFINSISRADLNKILMTAAEKFENVKIHFNHEVLSIDFEQKNLVVKDNENGNIYNVNADLIIGADGANSAVRQSMTKQIPGYSSNIDWLEHGYKELCIPADENGGFRIANNALHIWPRGFYMLIALPNFDGSFTCTLFFPNEGPDSFATLDTAEKVRNFFMKEFPDAVPHLVNLEQEFLNNPVGKLGTLKCYPWVLGDSAVLVGDAAHAIVPFYGQGMNASFEDCRVLNECIEEFGTDWEKVLSKYQELRKINGDAIGDLAVENFYEMRDHVANPIFQRKRKLELSIENKYADYCSKYALVTFRPDMPYSYALSQGNKQDEYLMSLCEKTEDVNSLDLETVYKELIAL